MTNELNAQWRLAATPKGGLPVAEDFLWVTQDLPEPAQNQMLTQTVYL
jgi:NADPH-dependent curcumin reductase CurA